MAERLGLGYEAPPHPSQLGTLRGDFRGFRVSVLPEHSRLVVELPRTSLIDLRNYIHWKRQPPTMEAFSFGVRWADDWFVGRYCDPALAERMHGDPAWALTLQNLRPFQQRLKQLTLEGRRLECVFDYGSPPHIPAGAVESVLPRLVELAAKCMLASSSAS